MTGPSARDPLPGEPEHRDRWPDATRPDELCGTCREPVVQNEGGWRHLSPRYFNHNAHPAPYIKDAARPDSTPEWRDVSPLRRSIFETDRRNTELGVAVSSMSLPALSAALDASPRLPRRAASVLTEQEGGPPNERYPDPTAPELAGHRAERVTSDRLARSGVPCSTCGMPYDRCTVLVLDQGRPCCSSCGRVDTHDEREDSVNGLRSRFPDGPHDAWSAGWLSAAAYLDAKPSDSMGAGPATDIAAPSVTERLEAQAADAVADLTDALDLDAGARDVLARAGVDALPDDETPEQFRDRMLALLDQAGNAMRCGNRLHWYLDGPEHRLAHALEIVRAAPSVPPRPTSVEAIQLRAPCWTAGPEDDVWGTEHHDTEEAAQAFRNREIREDGRDPGPPLRVGPCWVREVDGVLARSREDEGGRPIHYGSRAEALSLWSAAPPVPPQPTVPRAPVEALLAALGQSFPAQDYWGQVHAAVAKVQRHLDATPNQPEEGQR